MLSNKTLLDRQEPDIWPILSIMILAGVGLVAIISLQAFAYGIGWTGCLSSFGTMLLVAGASMSGGGLLGFLFGIPKMISSQDAVGDNHISRRAITQNDNLVQISDWLTKIIVGVGLTQLYNIPGSIRQLGLFLSPSFPRYSDKPELASAYAIVCVVYFLIVGFLCAYVWTRVSFTKMLEELEQDLDGAVAENLESLTRAFNESQSKSVDVGGGKNVSMEVLNSLMNAGQTTAINPNSPDDPQKGKWGGKAEANGRRLSAKVEASSLPELYKITLTVQSTDENNPLAGLVKFHLHNSFRNQHPLIAVQDGKAVLKLSMVYGAFTVGVEADDGKTRLELDLAELDDAPKDFRER
jgi:hypothetical protein